MTNNLTSLKLSKLQQQKVAYITKENGMYLVGTENDWALFDQKQQYEYKTLEEVKEAINNIIPFLTTNEKNEFYNKQKIKSLKDDYKWAKKTNDNETMKECLKELAEYGITESEI